MPTPPPITPNTLTFIGGSKDVVCPPFGCAGPATGNQLTIRITSPKWKSISSFCLNFTFSGDLLSQGEWLDWKDETGTLAHGLIGGPTYSSRKWCAASSGELASIEPTMLDGDATFNIFMVEGSVHIAGIDLTLTGDAA